MNGLSIKNLRIEGQEMYFSNVSLNFTEDMNVDSIKKLELVGKFTLDSENFELLENIEKLEIQENDHELRKIKFKEL